MPTPRQTTTPTTVTRRELLELGGAHLLLTAVGTALPASLLRGASFAQEKAPAPLHRFPRMVQEHFVRRVHEVEEAAECRRAALRTKADAEAYVRDVRLRIRLAFGPQPERTPLKPRVTKTVEREGYRIENVIFESRPGFPVTANLYIPTGVSSPRPGVVGTCGHSSNGKAETAYQSFSQGLARLGYVVLIYDPIGQGERLQYPDDNLRSRVGVGVREHLLAGNQQFLVGDFIGAWRAWDGIRALDYLLTRPEVDPQHVGVTGNSGGGTMTTWLCGVEDRWTMAAPSCFVTTFRRNLENELPADTEQCPPRALALGLDHADFLAAMAPKPVIILAKEQDYFDVRGSEEAYERLRRIYGLLGAEHNIKLFVGPTGHGYSQENRVAMYGWFHRATGRADLAMEPPITIEKDETLWCAPDGQVARLDAPAVPSFTRARSQELAKARPPKIEPTELAGRVREALRLPASNADASPPDFRILRDRRPKGYPRPYATAYCIETEPGVHAVSYRLAKTRRHSRPPRDGGPAILYVAHHSSDAEMRSEPLVRELLEAQPDISFYTCDVRGIGESRPDTCGANSFLQPYGSDYFYAIHALMFDAPYVGQKTHDVLRVLDWLAAVGHSEIHLVATGWGAFPATFAGVLSNTVSQVTLKGALTSYSEVAETEMYSWPLSTFVPGVLESFDLPDCYRVLTAAKKLRQIDPRGADGKPVAG